MGAASDERHRDITFRSVLAAGTSLAWESPGVSAAAGPEVYTDPFGSGRRTDEVATWTSPATRLDFAASEIVASWSASTPGGTWIEVRLRGRTSAGRWSGWYVLGRWASDDRRFHRTSVPGQDDADGRVAADVLRASEGFVAAQARVALHRPVGSTATPVLDSLGLMASALPDDAAVDAGAPGGACGVALAVPRRSQRLHRGHFPEYGGGGDAWCSPASVAMVAAYWNRRAGAADLDRVGAGHVDPDVDAAAEGTFDHAFSGTGNWSFNAAYAAGLGLAASVTRLRGMGELEEFIQFGIPVVASVSFRSEELDGAGYSTQGHLLVVAGFTDAGDVLVNDPGAEDNESVSRTYPREQFANVWLPASRSHGIVYLIRPPDRPLPPHPPGLPGNW